MIFLLHTAPAILDLKYTPPIARQRPTTLEALISLPPSSTSRFQLSYESSYLWYTEYPSDAHRGFEVPGAVIILLAPSSNSSIKSSLERPIESLVQSYRLHTTSTLLSLPTPDFSMPYNVIILTSTAMALFFGSVMNALVRNWFVVDLDADGDEELVEAEKGDEAASGEKERIEVE